MPLEKITYFSFIRTISNSNNYTITDEDVLPCQNNFSIQSIHEKDKLNVRSTTQFL